MNKDIQKCSKCGKTFDLNEEGILFNGEYMCDHCKRELTIICNHCGKRVLKTDAVRDWYCNDCFDNYYTICEGCGVMFHQDSAHYRDDDTLNEYPYCESCFSEIDHAIHSYYHKPTPIFYGNDKLYYGCELEVDDAGEDDYNAELILNIANRDDDHIYIKHDGSLEDGFEIVTHPMTLDYHKNIMPWQEVIQKLIRMGYRSHQADTCGLHFHVNKSGLGDTTAEQEEVIGRILYFFEKYWYEILNFSRRTEDQADRWARRYNGSIENPKASLEKAKRAHSGRYMAINLQNPETVEFRIFRGTLKYSTFLASLQFVDELCNDAIALSDEDFEVMTWSDFVGKINKTEKPELIEYLKLHRLYINEAVTSGEEI